MKQLLIIFVLAAVALIGGIYLAKSTPAVTTSSAATLPPVTSTDWSKGPENAKATIIEYLDLQCPSCAQVAPWMEKLMDEDGQDLRVVYRYFPLPQHMNAIPAAKAAEAAGKQGKFFGMAKLLFSRQQNWENEKDPQAIFEQYATELQLNLDQFKQDRDAKSTSDRITASKNEAVNLRLAGTPSIFLNGQQIAPTSYDDLKKQVDEAKK